MYKVNLEKAEEPIANIHWIIDKAREFQKNIFFIDYAKDFDWMYHNKQIGRAHVWTPVT